MARPRIGICTALETARWTVWEREAFLLSRAYVDAIRAAGGLALMIPPDAAIAAEPDAVLDAVDALVLAGGADIDPAAYGAERHRCTTGTRPERDAAEIPLARRALERDLPLLGICRGMQLVNVALGGTLIQHLPDASDGGEASAGEALAGEALAGEALADEALAGGEASGRDRKAAGRGRKGEARGMGHGDHRRHLGSFDDTDHDVLLERGSLAARACGELRHATKSHHHQAVDRLGEGLVATGWSVLDDLVEAIEAPTARWALGVQWHPEVDPGSGVVAALVAEAAVVAPA